MSTFHSSQQKELAPNQQRNYQREIIEPIIKNLPREAQLLKYGSSTEGHPLMMVKAITNPANPTITIIAGTHGDEPASVGAAIKFIKDGLKESLDSINFIIYPCLNPDGYIINRRENGEGIDLNREFDCDGGPNEVNAFYNSLKLWSDSIDVILNLHEDDPLVISDTGPQDRADGMYLYEHKSANEESGFAHSIIAAVSKKFEVCSMSTLYGDQMQGGVISYGSDSVNSSLSKVDLLDNFLIKNNLSARSITVETPTDWPIQKREQAQLEIIFSSIKRVLSEAQLAQAKLLCRSTFPPKDSVYALEMQKELPCW